MYAEYTIRQFFGFCQLFVYGVIALKIAHVGKNEKPHHTFIIY